MDEQDEADAYYRAIIKALRNEGRKCPAGSNAGATIGALVSALAYFVSGVEDRNLRNGMVSDIADGFSAELAKRLKGSDRPTFEIIRKENMQ